MLLQEKIYTLRKEKGLSQDQLAEQLNVSRQAVSKWETGQSVPDPEKIAALSRFFSVTTDYLLLDTQESHVSPSVDGPVPVHSKKRFLVIGISLGFLGAVMLLIWGVCSMAAPAAAENLQASSAIHLDGTGVFLLLCVLTVGVGGVFLVRSLTK